MAETRERAAKVLREILDHMGVDAEVSAFDDGERIILDAHGAESGLVIGKKGAPLDALQYLVIDRHVPLRNRHLRAHWNDETVREELVGDADVGAFLVDLAQRLAEKVVASGRPVPVEPMSAHDRRIVHMALVDHEGVTTESEGEGSYRRVVIFPKGDGRGREV